MKIRSTGTLAIAAAMLATAFTFAPISGAQASGYGYYSPGNGYYGYKCRWVRYRWWNGYGWEWRKRKVCS